MSNVAPEIAAAQAEYAARPYAVHWTTSYFSGTFRFHTLNESYEYILDQWKRIRARVARERYFASNLWQSELETPDGRVQLAYVLLTADVSSY